MYISHASIFASSSNTDHVPSNVVANSFISVLVPSSCLSLVPATPSLYASSMSSTGSAITAAPHHPSRWNPRGLLSFGERHGNAVGDSRLPQSPGMLSFSSVENKDVVERLASRGSHVFSSQLPRNSSSHPSSDVNILRAGLGKTTIDAPDDSGGEGGSATYVPCDPKNIGWSIMDKSGFAGRSGANENGTDGPVQLQRRTVDAHWGIGAKTRSRSNGTVPKSKKTAAVTGASKTGRKIQGQGSSAMKGGTKKGAKVKEKTKRNAAAGSRGLLPSLWKKSYTN